MTVRILLLLFLTSFTVKSEQQNGSFEEVERVFSFERTTYYNPIEEQTDSYPLETADGSIIDLERLQKGELKWCAVSRELLKKWGGSLSFGDSIDVEFMKNPELNGKWIIHDITAQKYRNTIDLLVHQDQPIRLYRKENATFKTIEKTWQN